jgi:hypothetical protein
MHNLIRQYWLEHCCKLVLEPPLNPIRQDGAQRHRIRFQVRLTLFMLCIQVLTLANYCTKVKCWLGNCVLHEKKQKFPSFMAWLYCDAFIREWPSYLVSSKPTLSFYDIIENKSDQQWLTCFFVPFHSLFWKMKRQWWSVFSLSNLPCDSGSIFGVTWRLQKPRDDNALLRSCSWCFFLLKHIKYPALLYCQFYLAILPILFAFSGRNKQVALGRIRFGVVHIQRPTACERVLYYIAT